jgi:hypothetical protein
MTFELQKWKIPKDILQEECMYVCKNFYGIRATITDVNQAPFKELKLTCEVNWKAQMYYKFFTLFL